MLRCSMFCLVCALTFAVFGFGNGPLPSWMLAQALAVLFFALAMVGLAFATALPRTPWRTQHIMHRSHSRG